MSELCVAIVGYGLAGRFFHAPLVAATPGLRVGYIVTANEERRAQARAERPEAVLVASVDELWSAPTTPRLVVVASGTGSHAAIATAALEHKIPVLVDKPLAPSAAEGASLVARARALNVPLTVFQNRRYDTDHLTLRRLLADGELGQVTRYESRFERWRPEPRPEAWRESLGPASGGGVLLDLGAHLVDQALVLFGPVSEAYAEIEARRGTAGDDDCFLALRHLSGPTSHLYMSAVAPIVGPRLRVHGTAAGFEVAGIDPQEAALRAGQRPGETAAWGMPADADRGRLVRGEQSTPVAPEAGAWPRFYAELAEALRAGRPLPVDPEDAVVALRVLEAARESARLRQVVQVTG